MIPIGGSAVPLGAAAGAWQDLLLYGSCLAVALLLAALIIELARRWVRRNERSTTASDQLANYRTLYKRGEISQEEFDRLRAVLGGELLPGVKPAPPRPPAPKPTDAPPAPPADGIRPE